MCSCKFGPYLRANDNHERTRLVRGKKKSPRNAGDNEDEGENYEEDPKKFS